MEQAQAVGSGGKLVGKVGAVRGFLADVQAEMKKVTWPTRQELLDATKRVIIMTLVIGVVIGVLDRVLQWILVDGIAAMTR
jgi:preprotein translocase subunit SecE